MIIMSYTCYTDDAISRIIWLTKDVGVTVIKAIDDVTWTGPDIKSKILFYIDVEMETLLTLKYPTGTFQKHMA